MVSQPKPEGEKSPYFDLAEKYKLNIDFRPFIHVEGVSVQEFRTHKIDFKEHTAVILTSKTAVDHFFRIAEEIRFEVPDTMKYFCISEAVALYLQKYVTYRKRKIFFGKQTIEDLIDPIKKHKGEKFLLPCTDILRDKIPLTLEEAKIPVLVDAGVGTASDATIAMELGCDAVLMNSAIAHAQQPVLMAEAMKHAIVAGRMAYLAGRMPKKLYASASSPLDGLIK